MCLGSATINWDIKQYILLEKLSEKIDTLKTRRCNLDNFNSYNKFINTSSKRNYVKIWKYLIIIFCSSSANKDGLAQMVPYMSLRS